MGSVGGLGYRLQLCVQNTVGVYDSARLRLEVSLTYVYNRECVYNTVCSESHCALIKGIPCSLHHCDFRFYTLTKA
jgi:hypothetical protein